MSSILRVVLILGAFAILFVIVKKLRKAQIQVLDSVFWLFFALSFVVFAAVPQIAFWLAGALGFESPSNFVFLYAIALLLYREFSNTVKIAELRRRVNALVEALALK